MLDLLAPQVGLEPTTLRLTGEFLHLQEVAPRRVHVDYNKLTSLLLAASRTEVHGITV